MSAAFDIQLSIYNTSLHSFKRAWQNNFCRNHDDDTQRLLTPPLCVGVGESIEVVATWMDDYGVRIYVIADIWAFKERKLQSRMNGRPDYVMNSLIGIIFYWVYLFISGIVLNWIYYFENFLKVRSELWKMTRYFTTNCRPSVIKMIFKYILTIGSSGRRIFRFPLSFFPIFRSQ